MQICKTLCMDLQWVAKQNHKLATSPHKLHKVVNIMHIKMTCDQAVLIKKNSDKLVSTHVWIWTQAKSSQVHVSQCKWVVKWNASWMQVKNLCRLASTCESIWPRPKGKNRINLTSIQVYTPMQKCNVALVNRFSGRRQTNMADGKDREDET